MKVNRKCLFWTNWGLSIDVGMPFPKCGKHRFYFKPAIQSFPTQKEKPSITCGFTAAFDPVRKQQNRPRLTGDLPLAWDLDPGFHRSDWDREGFTLLVDEGMHGPATVSTMAILIPGQFRNLLVEDSFVEEMGASKTGSLDFFSYQETFHPQENKSWLDLHSEGPCRSKRFCVLRTCDSTSFAGALIFRIWPKKQLGSLRIQALPLCQVTPFAKLSTQASMISSPGDSSSPSPR